MKQILLITAYATLLGLLTGCKKTELVGKGDYFSHSYLTALIEVGQIDTTVFSENSILVILGGTNYLYERDQTEFKALCQSLGDWSYDREIGHDAAVGSDYCIDEFTVIEVVSDLDFDAEHPAGTSLNGLLTLYAISAAPYIASGYDDQAAEENRQALGVEFSDIFYSAGGLGRSGDYLIKKSLDEVVSDDLRLLDARIALEFTTPPPVGTHHFTVTLRSDEKTISKTIEVEIK